FRRQMFAFTVTEMLTDRLALLRSLLWRELAVLAVPSAAGAALAVRGRWGPAVRDVAVMLTAVAGATTVFALGYAVPDVHVFFLPLHLVAAVFLGLGLEALAGPWMRRVRTPGVPSR